MKLAYVDTSCVVAVFLGEPGSPRLARRLASFHEVFASSLLEAEWRATASREKVAVDDTALDALRWVQPDRRLTPELKRVLEVGYVRGADAWHLACALYVFAEPDDATFLTLDRRQRAAAKKLGFAV